MTASIFLARLLGPMLVVVGIGLLLKPMRFRAILQEFIGSVIWLYWAGFVGLLAGLALVLTHNLWVSDWRVIITLIGWVTLVRALVTIFQPEWIVMIGNAVIARPRYFVAAAAMNLILGLILSYLGYAA